MPACLAPALDRVPLFGNVLQSQIQQFNRSFLGGKRTSILGQFAQSYVQRFDCIGRVDDLTNLLGKVEERDHPLSSAVPDVGYYLVFRILAPELNQRGFALDGRGAVNRPDWARSVIYALPGVAFHHIQPVRSNVSGSATANGFFIE